MDKIIEPGAGEEDLREDLRIFGETVSQGMEQEISWAREPGLKEKRFNRFQEGGGCPCSQSV